MGFAGVDTFDYTVRDDEGNTAKLAHVLPEDSKQADADSMVDLAESELKNFAVLLQSLVDRVKASDMAGSSVAYSLGVKTKEAIKKKADRKYAGDILQVKDILRGELVFVDESSLVLALLQLRRLCSNFQEDVTGETKFEIVRVKNLFHKSALGVLCPSVLPTGYRHILVNVRLNGLLLAGK